jgi:hypothetical protein
MRIEALEAIKSGTYVVTEGDIITVPDEVGARWCALGWAKDTAGVVATGERRVLDARIAVDPVRHGQQAEKVEG